MDHADSYRLSRPEGAALLRSRDVIDLAPETSSDEPGSAPPIHRGTMVPTPWLGFGHGALRLLNPSSRAKHVEAPWLDAAAWRRRLLVALVLGSTVGAAVLSTQTQTAAEPLALRVIQTALFAILFGWVSTGFFTALMGFMVQIRGDKHSLSAASVAADTLADDARTAIIMPICNEHVPTVFAGLRATCESLAATGHAKNFDVFVLSDSGDPSVRAAELAAWAELRETLGEGGAHVHYRWRLRRTKKKAGNVADFCRRWGRDYRYMVVLDADSVMSGDCLVTLAKLMEANPSAGILQTAPQACGLSTLHARAQQFAGRVTGQLFTAGMQYWQLGESYYWGHNAILRVEPFMKHCALARLEGTGGLSGEILSHDFVEAALMRRAGFHVWLVSDLQGSYEQVPPDLMEELNRDRRWCQGNLQNARLVAEPGLHGVHRGMLLMGAMAYLSAPLWLSYMLMGGALWATADYDVFGIPAVGVGPMIALWGGTLLMLLAPRALAVVAVLKRGEAAVHGGAFTLVKGALIEAALSVALAPIRMMGHSIFVFSALTGMQLNWKSPPREATVVSWNDAFRRFGPVSALVAVLAAVVAYIDPWAALWLAPIGLPLLLAAPLTVLTSHVGIGERIRARQLLTTPEEASTPSVLRHAWTYARRSSAPPSWHEIVSNPWLLDVIRSAMGPRSTARGWRGLLRRQWVESVINQPDVNDLPPLDRMRLLSEPETLGRLRNALAANASTRRSLEELAAVG